MISALILAAIAGATIGSAVIIELDEDDAGTKVTGSAESDDESGDDFITGSQGDDIISALSGDDTINAGAGDDMVDGSFGDDRIAGGDGNDTIYAGRGDDLISLGDGDDTVTAGRGDDTVEGDGGDDVIYGQRGDDVLSGGEGSNTLSGGKNADIFVLDTSEGTFNTVTDVDLQDEIVINTDAPISPNDVALIPVSDGSLSLEVNGNTIASLAGDVADLTVDDLLFRNVEETGLVAEDILAGQTQLFNVIEGTDGNDDLEGTDGPDQVFLLAGDDDRFDAGDGDDYVFGGPGSDFINGEDGDDELAGGAGSDELDGGNGNDILRGGGSSDVLFGDFGDDRLSTGSGEFDALLGDEGNDTLIAESQGSFSSLIGGDGDDTFILEDGHTGATVEDFHEEDQIVIRFDGPAAPLEVQVISATQVQIVVNPDDPDQSYAFRVFGPAAGDLTLDDIVIEAQEPEISDPLPPLLEDEPVPVG